MLKRNLTTALTMLLLAGALALTACGGGGGGNNNGGGVLGPPPVAMTGTPSATLTHIGWGAQTGLNIWGDPGAVAPWAQIKVDNGNQKTIFATAAQDGSFNVSVDLVHLESNAGDILLVTAKVIDMDESDPLQVVIPEM